MQTMSPKRPQLTTEQAEQFHYLEVMKRTGPAGQERIDPWDPLADPFMGNKTEVSPQYRLNGDGPYGALQALIDRAVRKAIKAGSTDRIYIELGEGMHQGLVYIPALVVNGTCVPITLYAAHKDPQRTTIIDTIDAEMPSQEYAQKFGALFTACCPEIKNIHDKISARDGIITTANASVMRIENQGFQLRGITVRNAYNADREQPGRGGWSTQCSRAIYNGPTSSCRGFDRGC